MRKYNIDHTFFREINTEEKAYFLGVLASDGHISHNKTRHHISLSMTDIDVVEKFKKAISSETPISLFYVTPRCKQTAKIIVCSTQIVHDLEEIKLTGKKSHRTYIPAKIPSNLIKDYIRGYFDGDGSIVFEKRRNCYYVNITSCSERILKEIENYFKMQQILNFNHNYISQGHGNCFALRVFKRKEVSDFLSHLYENSKVYMDRKFTLYKKVMTVPIRNKFKNKTSTFWGVHRNNNKYEKCWTTSFRIKDTILRIGNFNTEKEAAIAYNNYIINNNLKKELNTIF